MCSHWGSILIIKPNRCTNFSNLFLEWNSTCFGQFLYQSSGVFHCTNGNGISHTVLLTAVEQKDLLLLASCQDIFMTYIIAVCTVINSWWWTEELSETCRVSSPQKFEILLHLFSCIVRNVTRCTVTWTWLKLLNYRVAEWLEKKILLHEANCIS
jgi:hypothetical protein